MVLNNDKLILIYGFSQEEIVNIGELILDNNLVKFKVIDRHSGKMTVENIIQGVKLPLAYGNVNHEKVVLFNNLTDEELEKTIKIFRNNIDKKTIFAVVTPTSIKWTFDELLEHLVQERKWVEKRKSKG
ncbi:hypothetical protein CPAST_c37970 [Clostridium pasteurianum DSM 525 = ATCC 6013]|uniref:Putative conserved protein UCP014543 n=1 Tax=Clostridium pasteurianum DSM 525 = ATCC 6013 TaxID=1262449 RepID=A0A0H3JBJ4_CLOPA|nr:DUF3783 domain-containing protein [Clostridium pasteurianum]AJA49835.1 hypothetical protein CPAST_c37970 [Clostridium pasteurianum DSM 525 = ATCC 6013]AJA53823.1 hypothetical protein CLPA_c37970 [Clostridium pasteurianum DSM 525 = ATCC 6013]AOZ76979.1 hypothetical protein AQ983_18465 [Clostridium pasteurianum DSM 525 = ATCC 6013]AOZ80776.1 hypothetical protein AQ984_18460 [Clostridium pasteurianum]ELP57794.1 hypothetical protein F502_17557 [Clostridium pasteurianum DSM 525 = ATCC 6013]